MFVGDRIQDWNSRHQANGLGIAGSVLFGLTGADFFKNISDISHGIENWEGNPSDYLNLGLNLIAVVPVIGSVKNIAKSAGGEVVQTVTKNVDDEVAALRHIGDNNRNAKDFHEKINQRLPSGNVNDTSRELLHGSGPRRGFLEVSDRVMSTKAVQNFRSKNPIDFRFDPENGRFVMGKGGILGHDAIPGVISDSPGGRIRFENGKLITDEWSGHYGHLWTPEIHTKFVEFMKSHWVEVTHVPWRS